MWNWDSRTHQFIASLALQKCYKPFENMLKLHQDFYILGIEAPDRIFKDFTNHYYNCTPNKYGYHYGKVIDKIAREIELLEQMAENPDQVILHPKIAPFLKSLLDTPLKAFIFELGVLSHYIADLHQPFHTDGKERFADEKTVHKILEADVRKHLSEFNIQLGRRKRIKNPKEYFTEQIHYINEFYDRLIDNYYKSKGKVKADRWQGSKAIIVECLGLAAQNVANVYLSFERSNRVFKNHIRQAKLGKKIRSSLKIDKKYYLKKYRSGTISIRAKKT